MHTWISGHTLSNNTNLVLFNRILLSYIRIPVSSHPCQLVPMSTRTHVNSYPCQLVPPIDVNSYHKWCQLVPSLGVNSYPKRQVSDDGTNWHLLPHNRCQLVPMSTCTTNRCQLVPQVATSDVNSYPTRWVSDYGTLTTHQSTRTVIRCELLPKIIFWRIMNVR